MVGALLCYAKHRGFESFLRNQIRLVISYEDRLRSCRRIKKNSVQIVKSTHGSSDNLVISDGMSTSSRQGMDKRFRRGDLNQLVVTIVVRTLYTSHHSDKVDRLVLLRIV